MNKTLKLSSFSGILFVLLQLFRWELWDAIAFIEMFIELLILILFVVSIVFSIINLFRAKKKRSKKAIFPLLVNIVTIFIITFFPFNTILLNSNFSMNKNAREEVVHLIENGSIKSNIQGSRGIIHLPHKYNTLSKGGGDIIVSKSTRGNAIFFFTFRGVLDNFSGFAYCPDSSKSCIDQFINKEDMIESSRMDNHWYWIASH